MVGIENRYSLFYNVSMIETAVETAVKKFARFCAHVTFGIKRNKEMWHAITNTKGASRKLKQLRCEMNTNRLVRIGADGLRSGKITDFNEDFYAKMSHTFFQGIPISMIIKYFAPNENAREGKCFERSLLMFLCFDNALLVRGDSINIELTHGKGQGRHGWIEIGDDVYDPTTLWKYQKDLYYKMIKATNIEKMTYEEYTQQDERLQNLCAEVKSTTIADFQPNGRRRTQLLHRIPEIKTTPEYRNNPEFQKDLDDYLKLVQYPTQEQTVDNALEK